MTDPERPAPVDALLGFLLGVAITFAAFALADAVLSRPKPPRYQYDRLFLPPTD